MPFPFPAFYNGTKNHKNVHYLIWYKKLSINLMTLRHRVY